MISKNAERLLGNMKAVQQDSSSSVVFDGFSGISQSSVSGSSCSLELEEDLSKEVTYLLQELIASGCIVRENDQDTYKLTSNGWKYSELHRREILYAILKSVLAPLIVSVVTTLLTLWLSHR